MQPQNPITLQLFNESVKAALAGTGRDAIFQNMGHLAPYTNYHIPESS